VAEKETDKICALCKYKAKDGKNKKDEEIIVEASSEK